MSLEQQIRCMQEMRDYLEDFNRTMKEVMNSLQKDIKFLRSQGLSVEIEEAYQRNYFGPANDRVDHVVFDINHKHFDYIDRVIEKLKRAAHEQ